MPLDVLLADERARLRPQQVPREAEDLSREVEHAEQVERLGQHDPGTAEGTSEPSDDAGLQVFDDPVGESLDAAGHRGEHVAEESHRIVDDHLERLLRAPHERVEGFGVDPDEPKHRFEHAHREGTPVTGDRRRRDAQGERHCRLVRVDDRHQPRAQSVDERRHPGLEAVGHDVDRALGERHGRVDGLVQRRGQLGEDLADEAGDGGLEELAVRRDRVLDESGDGVDRRQRGRLDGVEDVVDGTAHRVEHRADRVDQRVEGILDEADGAVPPALLLRCALGLLLLRLGLPLALGDLVADVDFGRRVRGVDRLLVIGDAGLDRLLVDAALVARLALDPFDLALLRVDRVLPGGLDVGARGEHRRRLLAVRPLVQPGRAGLRLGDRALLRRVAVGGRLLGLRDGVGQRLLHRGVLLFVERHLHLGRQLHRRVRSGSFRCRRRADHGCRQLADRVRLVERRRLDDFGARACRDRLRGFVSCAGRLRLSGALDLRDARGVGLAAERNRRWRSR